MKINLETHIAASVEKKWQITPIALVQAITATDSPKFLFPQAGQVYASMDQIGGRINFCHSSAQLSLPHLRVEDPLFSHTLFGVYSGLIMWLGLWLRDPTLRKLLPWHQAQA